MGERGCPARFEAIGWFGNVFSDHAPDRIRLDALGARADGDATWRDVRFAAEPLQVLAYVLAPRVRRLAQRVELVRQIEVHRNLLQCIAAIRPSSSAARA